MRRRPLVVAATIVIGAVVIGAGIPATGAAGRVEARFARRGPYASGVTTLRIGDRRAEVWYPIARHAASRRHRARYRMTDALPSDARPEVAGAGLAVSFTTDAIRDRPVTRGGPFPIVVFAHAYGGYRSQSSFLTTHLATWGFVAVAPDFLERTLGVVVGATPARPCAEDEVVDAAVAVVRAAARSRRGPLVGAVRGSGRVAVIGHSAGATTALRYSATHPVAAVVALAGADTVAAGRPAVPLPPTPTLFVAGAGDRVSTPREITRFFALAPTPRRLVVIGGAGHLNAMTDVCAIGRAGRPIRHQGDVWLRIPASRARLGTNGCLAPYRPSAQVWPVTRHAVVAELRWAFGIDRNVVGMDRASLRAFAPIRTDVRAADGPTRSP